MKGFVKLPQILFFWIFQDHRKWYLEYENKIKHIINEHQIAISKERFNKIIITSFLRASSSKRIYLYFYKLIVRKLIYSRIQKKIPTNIIFTYGQTARGHSSPRAHCNRILNEHYAVMI